MYRQQEYYNGEYNLRSGSRIPWTVYRRVKVDQVRTKTVTIERETTRTVTTKTESPLYVEESAVPSAVSQGSTERAQRKRQMQLADFFEPPPTYSRPAVLKKLKKTKPPKYALGKPLSLRDYLPMEDIDEEEEESQLMRAPKRQLSKYTLDQYTNSLMK